MILGKFFSLHATLTSIKPDGTLVVNIILTGELTAVYSTKSKEESTNTCLLVSIEHTFCTQRINIISQRNNSGYFPSYE